MSNTNGNGMVAVTGNTYPVKDRLKALSPRVKWDGDQKAWMVPADKQAEAVAIVASAGPVQPRSTTGSNGRSNYRPSRCKECGASPNARGWPRIYRNGICSDCYKSEREEAEMGY